MLICAIVGWCLAVFWFCLACWVRRKAVDRAYRDDFRIGGLRRDVRHITERIDAEQKQNTRLRAENRRLRNVVDDIIALVVPIDADETGQK